MVYVDALIPSADVDCSFRAIIFILLTVD